MKSRAEKRVFRIKVVASVVLVIGFAAVVFSMPAEKLAWQAPYVIGTLLLPKPSPGPFVRTDAMRENAYSSFSLLGFFSVVGILALAGKRLLSAPPPRGRSPRPTIPPLDGNEVIPGPPS